MYIFSIKITPNVPVVSIQTKRLRSRSGQDGGTRRWRAGNRRWWSRKRRSPTQHGFLCRPDWRCNGPPEIQDDSRRMQHDIGCNHPPVGHRFGKIFYGGCYRREDACPMQSQDLPEKNGKHNTKQREPALPAGLLGIKKKTAENEKKGATKNNFGIIVALHDEDSGLFTVE